MLLVFMIFITELTNQILLPGKVHSQMNGCVYMLTAFASFLADSEDEEQDDGFLGEAKAPTVYLSQNKWLSLIALTAKAVLSGRKKIISVFLTPVSGR